MAIRRGKQPVARTSRDSKVKVRVFGTLLLLTGVVFLVTGGRTFAYAARLAGTQGTFQVLYSEQVYGTGRGGTTIDTVWKGTFRSADGKITDNDATLQDEADGHEPGSRIRVTRADARTYYDAQPDYALFWLCLCLAGGSLVAWSFPAVWFGQISRRTDHPKPRGVRAALLTARSAWWCAIASGAAALVMALVA